MTINVLRVAVAVAPLRFLSRITPRNHGMVPGPTRDFNRHRARLCCFTILFCALSASLAETGFQRLRSFGFPELSGMNPLAELIEGTNGVLYGTTWLGGSNNFGTVFQVGKDGMGYIALKTFTGSNGDGAQPFAGLLQASDGALYGTTYYGGSNNLGTIFTLAPNGSNYLVLHSFQGTNSDGANPRGSLIEGTNGVLYGTTCAGGISNLGTIFQLNKDGSGYSVLRHFTGATTNGSKPYDGMIVASDGALYGSTHLGGTFGFGTLFRIQHDGTGFATLRSFSGDRHPNGIIEGGDGVLYGTTRVFTGGQLGTVFRLNKNGSGYTNLHPFSGLTNGSGPRGKLVEHNGVLYGTTYSGGTGTNLGTVFKLDVNGSNYMVLRSFLGTVVTNNISDGDGPQAGLLRASDGNLYGTTYAGGMNNYGTIFTLQTNASNYAVIHWFLRGGGDGCFPNSAIEASDGLIYGTTESGGSNDLGTLFRVGKDGGNYTPLKSFGGGINDGSGPNGVIEASDGILYGTTYFGGSNNVGTVFRINKNGTDFAILRHCTASGTNGAHPLAELIEGHDGHLYGTTHYSGGIGGVTTLGGGTIFRLGKDGGNFAVIRGFGGSTANPRSRLLQASDGFLYGTTRYASSAGWGTVFKVNTNGTGFATLRTFSQSGADGVYPWSGLVEGSDGVLYGTTTGGGTNDFGTIYRLEKDGSNYSVIHRFRQTDGNTPWAGLVRRLDGGMYGTTESGRSNRLGSVFRLGGASGPFSALHTFDSESIEAGGNPQAELVNASDGALYGAASEGGDMDLGTLFRVSPPVFISQIENPGSNTVLTLIGAHGDTTRILAATNLTNPAWLVVGTNTFDSNGLSQFLDTDAPDHPVRFYKTATP